MRKYSLLIFFILIANFYVAAKPIAVKHRFGVKISPCISFNRLHTNPDTSSFSSNGSALKFSIGPIYDISIGPNYYISTGLWYGAKRVTIKNNKLSIEETHKLEYLQLPVFIKLYTSEVYLDTKLYSHLGAVIEINIEEMATKIKERKIDNQKIKKPFITQFKPLDLSVLIGIGVEYTFSPPTSVFAGISYQRGFINSIKGTTPAVQPPIIFKNDLFYFDLGLRF